MANGDNKHHLKGHMDREVAGVGGNTPAHNNIRSQSAYKSKEVAGWKKIEIPESQDFRERKRSGKDVPMPPELHLP